jgi:hypothetical protein
MDNKKLFKNRDILFTINKKFTVSNRLDELFEEAILESGWDDPNISQKGGVVEPDAPQESSDPIPDDIQEIIKKIRVRRPGEFDEDPEEPFHETDEADDDRKIQASGQDVEGLTPRQPGTVTQKSKSASKDTRMDTVLENERTRTEEFLRAKNIDPQTTKDPTESEIDTPFRNESKLLNELEKGVPISKVMEYLKDSGKPEDQALEDLSNLVELNSLRLTQDKEGLLKTEIIESEGSDLVKEVNKKNFREFLADIRKNKNK